MDKEKTAKAATEPAAKKKGGRKPMTAEEKAVAANVLAVSKAKSDSLKPTALPILTIAAAVLAILSIAVFTLENRKTFHGTTENICFLSAPGARNADTSSYSIVWLCCLKSYTKRADAVNQNSEPVVNSNAATSPTRITAGG